MLTDDDDDIGDDVDHNDTIGDVVFQVLCG
jgi:hypothetical protein